MSSLLINPNAGMGASALQRGKQAASARWPQCCQADVVSVEIQFSEAITEHSG